ncbi:hypothetical protein I302_101189 [Kwoniella bestiolae CBS 10118]|uniref:Uncharacterized protein n=1 Tax=Kwoniella bestiolae CBS 10118 TaxID=1296100 RepID=A0AAJ8M4F0_9TREE
MFGKLTKLYNLLTHPRLRPQTLRRAMYDRRVNERLRRQAPVDPSYGPHTPPPATESATLPTASHARPRALLPPPDSHPSSHASPPAPPRLPP